MSGRFVREIWKNGKAFSLLHTIIPAREILLQPDIEADEQIAAAHFLDLEFRLTGAAVAPGDGDDGEGKSSNDGFERELHCDVEVRREDRAYAIDHSFAVGLEGVRRIVKAVVEEDPHKRICQAVYKEFDRWIVDDPAALHEAAAEDTIIALVQLVPVAHHIAAIIGFIGHHDDERIAIGGIQAAGDSPPEAVQLFILHRSQRGNPLAHLLENGPGAVLATIVHHHDFMRHAVQFELQMQMLHRACDASFLVPGRDDDGEQFQIGLIVHFKNCRMFIQKSGKSPSAPANPLQPAHAGPASAGKQPSRVHSVLRSPETPHTSHLVV